MNVIEEILPRSEAQIKWDRELSSRADRKKAIHFSKEKVSPSIYRPYSKKYVYFDRDLNAMIYRLNHIFGNGDGFGITWSFGARSDFSILAVDSLPSLDMFVPSTTQFVPRSYTGADSRCIDNITDWGLAQFHTRYDDPSITRDDIFAYAYGVLHDPVYRETYAENLRRDLPRIPLYDGFRRWRDWGQELLDLHLGYETIEPWPLERIEEAPKARRAKGDAPAPPPPTPRPILRADEAAGVIRLDTVTMLAGVPKEAFAYKLGNRSAIGWVLDQHKEKTPRDPTIREKFDTYRFADHKERVIDLLKRVTRVSVETMRITEAMRKAPR